MDYSRIMKVVGIRIRDERLYKRATKKLEELNIPFINLNRMAEIESVKVLLTDNRADKGIFVDENLSRAVMDCARKYYDNLRYKHIIIGIDPGPKPGIAVFGDEKLLDTFKAASPEKAADFVKNALRIHEHDGCTIRIGNGAGVYRNRTINALLSLKKCRIEIVDESRTSRSSDDTDAAKMIAFIKGDQMREPVREEADEGELREIQRESRNAFGFTISMELAREVAEGRLDLKKAVKIQKERK
jgi:hypothetical protein